MNKSSEAQLRASAAYRAKNKDKARLPGVLLSESEAVLLDELGELCGSKKAAIMAGLELLKEKVVYSHTGSFKTK